MCVHHGYPLYPLPGGNIFFTAEDESTPDGVVECKPLNAYEALKDAGQGLRYLSRFAELF